MTVRSKTELLSNINSDLADNNAGLISAADIRNNMIDVVDSVNQMVASGDFNAETPFSAENVRIKKNTSTNLGGELIVESGITFANGFNTDTQIMAYPGPGGIDHNELDNLDSENSHTQYMHIDGLNKATDNMPLGDVWVNSSGNLVGAPPSDDRGLKFEYVDNAVDIATDTSVSGEVIHIGSKSTLKFDTDGSYTKSAKGVAQAWVRFEGISGNVVVNSSYNVDSIVHTDNGHYKIFFTPNTFSDANYLAVGNSNSVAGAGSAEDFDVNTVGIVERDRDYLMFLVKSDDNEYVNAAVNDLVVFGNASGVIPSSSPTVTNLPT
jgi:hypothetical protein